MMNKNSIFLYFHAPHYFRNFISVIVNLQKKNYNIFILLDEKYSPKLYDTEKIRPENNIFFIYCGRYLWLKKMPIAGNLLYYFLYKRWCNKILKNKAVQTIVLSDDRSTNACILIEASKKLAIKKILLPVESFQSREARISVRLQQKFFVHKNILYYFIRNIYLQNYQNISNREVYWYPIKNFIILLLLGSLPRDPWLRGSNSIDSIAVSSTAQYEENSLHGIPKSFQAITGFPMHDQIVDAIINKKDIRDKIHKKYLIQNKKKILMIVGTTYKQLFGNTDYTIYYEETKKCVDSITQQLSDKYNIIYKIHPREKIEVHKSFLGKKLTKDICLIAGENEIYPFLGASDLVFIFLSSTVIGALALKCPIICYNLGNLKHFEPFYMPFQSIYKCKNQNDLDLAITKIQRHDDLTQNRPIDRDRFGLFNGSSTNMVTDLILG